MTKGDLDTRRGPGRREMLGWRRNFSLPRGAGWAESGPQAQGANGAAAGTFPQAVATLSRDSILQTSVRRLKLLVGVLVLSNCVLGVFSVALLRKLDRDYTALLDQTLPLIAQIRVVGRENTDVYRALVAGIVESDAKLCAESVQRAGKALERGRTARAQLLKSPTLQEKPGLLKEMADATAAYDDVARGIMAKLSPEMTPADQNASYNQLEQALERCRNSTRLLQEFVDARSQAISDSVSAEMRSRSNLVLGVAGWPLVIGVLIAIMVAGVLIVMFVILRRIGADDGP